MTWLLAAAVLAAGLLVGVTVWRSRPGGAPDGRLRIVSLAPSVTEMLFLLGLGDSVVGVTDYCDYPPEARRIERVGGLNRPNLEVLLARRPDLVIGTEKAPASAEGTLASAGATLLRVRIDSFADVFEGLRRIGRAAGREREAAEAVARMEAELKAVAASWGGVPREKRPRVFLEIWNDPLTTAGGPSFLDELVDRAGGVNVAHDIAQAHPLVNPEMVVEWNPDVVVIAHMARKGTTAEEVGRRIGWGNIKAVREGRVIGDIPPDILLRPGPRLVEGVRELARRLHGDRPAGPPAEGNERP